LKHFLRTGLNPRGSRLQVKRQRSKPFSGDHEERLANHRRHGRHAGFAKETLWFAYNFPFLTGSLAKKPAVL
jgi:hypothetical protein